MISMKAIRVVGLVCVVLIISGINGFEMNDLIKELPGQPMVQFRQFAGFVPVAPGDKRSLFYYFIEAETDAANGPLTLWLTGGPGCASSGEAFEGGMGPFSPVPNARTLQINPYAWNKVSNLLFVDSPVGAGWSSSSDPNDYYRGDSSTTDDLVSFMVSWYEKYPSFKSKPLYITGSSFAGHFAPNLAVALLKHNSQPQSFKFDIKGVALGNPLLRGKVDKIMSVELLLSRGMIKKEDYDGVLKECNYTDNMEYSAITSSPSCYDLIRNVTMAALLNNKTPIENFDILRDKCDKQKAAADLKAGKEVSQVKFGVDMCMRDKIDFYMNQPEVLTAFHVDRNQNTDKNYQGCFRQKLHYSAKEDAFIDMLPTLKQILEQGIKMTVFSGDEDGIIPANATKKNLDVLANDLKFPVITQNQTYNFNNQPAGWEVVYGDKLTFITVKGGNHHVTSSTPAVSLQIFSNFLSGKA